jgi:hypothetical protein
MDDFNIVSLRESRNEWCTRLINILTPKIAEGIMSIFTSARKLCVENNEQEKYLLTFQNLLTRIPQWNPEIIKEETNRILTTGNCKYLEDLITCVHIIQLKMLTYVRVGTKHKKIDLNIPKLNEFVHKVYILLARVLYQKAYLYSLEINTLERQKNNSIIETIIQECILNAIRDSIPYELIVRSYLDETDEICEEIKEEIIKDKSNNTKSKSKAVVHMKDTASSSSTASNTPKIYKSTIDDSIKETSGSLSKMADDIIKPIESNNSDLKIVTDSSSIVTPQTFNSEENTNVISQNSLFDNMGLGSSSSIGGDSTSNNNDLELSLCELPQIISEPVNTSLDYIELN